MAHCWNARKKYHLKFWLCLYQLTPQYFLRTHLSRHIASYEILLRRLQQELCGLTDILINPFFTDFLLTYQME